MFLLRAIIVYSRSSLVRMFTLLVLAMWLPANAAGHPSHVSITEIEWNAESERFEVAMRLRISDLEDALSARAGSRFRIESHRQREQLMREYLQQHFSVTFPGDDACLLRWVGMEPELHDVWVYFEVESGSAPGTGLSPKASDAPAPPVGTAAPPHTVLRWDELFRTPGPSGRPAVGNPRVFKPVQVRNTALLNIQPEQVNVVTLRVGPDVESFAMTRKQSEAVLFDARSAGQR